MIKDQPDSPDSGDRLTKMHPYPDPIQLRRKAEKRAEKLVAPRIESLSTDEAGLLLHELQVHQIELEMQNEELRRIQTELEESRQRYFDLYDLAPVGYCTLSEKGLILEANLMAASLLGVNRGALAKLPFGSFLFPGDKDIWYLVRKRLFETGQPQRCELRIMKKEGEFFWSGIEATTAEDEEGNPVSRLVFSDITKRKQAEEDLHRYRDHLEELVKDRTAELTSTNTRLTEEITERKKAEEQINNSLQEKEILLKEIHHRVKNNLMIITSIFRLQSSAISDSGSKEIFEECVNRVLSMARIHTQLYQSNDLARINFPTYLQDMIPDLFRAYQVWADTVTFNLEIENFFPDINTAIPMGLVVNELLTNSLKHAFPEGRKGQVTISLKKDDSRTILILADTGIGFPEHLDFTRTTSLGLQLVRALVSQLQGTMEMNREQGTVWTITFPVEQ